MFADRLLDAIREHAEDREIVLAAAGLFVLLGRETRSRLSEALVPANVAALIHATDVTCVVTIAGVVPKTNNALYEALLSAVRP